MQAKTINTIPPYGSQPTYVNATREKLHVVSRTKKINGQLESALRAIEEDQFLRGRGGRFCGDYSDVPEVRSGSWHPGDQGMRWTMSKPFTRACSMVRPQ